MPFVHHATHHLSLGPCWNLICQPTHFALHDDPAGLPLVGNLPSILTHDISRYLVAMEKKYGKVFKVCDITQKAHAVHVCLLFWLLHSRQLVH